MLDANKLQQAVEQAYTQFHSLNDGQNADYIPFLAVVPGVMGIAAFLPPLDEEGNSVRGQKMVASVAKQLGYNVFKG